MSKPQENSVNGLQAIINYARLMMFGALLCCAAHSNVSAAIIDFDALIAGDTVSTLDGVTFSSNTGENLIVATGLETTSGSNYLGVNNRFLDEFLGGDVLTFTFAEEVTEFSLAVVSVFVAPGALTLFGGGVSDVSIVADFQLPVFGDDVYLLSIISATPFSTATLTAAPGLVSFTIDDVEFSTLSQVPLPGAALLFITAVIGAVSSPLRQRSRSVFRRLKRSRNNVFISIHFIKPSPVNPLSYT